MCVALAAGGCAAGLPASRRKASPDTSPSPLAASSAASREAVVTAARTLLGKTRIQIGTKKYSQDCSGFVRAVCDQVGIDLFKSAQRGDNGVTAIYRFAEVHGRVYKGGRPIAGDLVFFHDTSGAAQNSGLTHVALVEQVEEDQTVWIIHRVRRGVVRYRMNLGRPGVRLDKAGKVLNDYLRFASPKEKDVLTGQLFTAYATILPVGGAPVATTSDSPRFAEPFADLQQSRQEAFHGGGSR